MGRVARLGTFVLLVAAIAACSLLPTTQTPDRPALEVSNGTTLAVTLFVNDVPAGVFPPGGPTPEVDVSRLPPLPWTVEARSVSGRVLVSMGVGRGQVVTRIRPDGVMSSSGAMGRVDLSCGRLTIWAGDFAPSGPPPLPNPGEPGDCIP